MEGERVTTLFICFGRARLLVSYLRTRSVFRHRCSRACIFNRKTDAVLLVYQPSYHVIPTVTFHIISYTKYI